MTLQTGQPAPAFSLPGSDGKIYSSDTLKGRTVVLYFYPKDDTPGCTKEACGFRDLHASIAAAGAVVLGVSRDPADRHEAFRARHRLPFPLLSDPDLAAHKAYGAWGRKMRYGKPVEGVIRSTVIIGPDGRIRTHWPRVANAEAHPAEVLKCLS